MNRQNVIVVAAQRWGKDYPGTTVGIIGRDAIEICEKYGIACYSQLIILK